VPPFSAKVSYPQRAGSRAVGQEETVATVRFVETYGMDATIGRALGLRGTQGAQPTADLPEDAFRGVAYGAAGWSMEVQSACAVSLPSTSRQSPSSTLGRSIEESP
jgi:hypothetical protein